jgi:hypothetical protein
MVCIRSLSLALLSFNIVSTFPLTPILNIGPRPVCLLVCTAIIDETRSYVEYDDTLGDRDDACMCTNRHKISYLSLKKPDAKAPPGHDGIDLKWYCNAN